MTGPTLRLATRNAHKLAELRRDPSPPARSSSSPPPATRRRTAASYRENARAKAAHGWPRREPGEWSVGEDSGIEVVALGGAPGIESARWAEDGVGRVLDGAGATTENRRARYVCRIVALGPPGDLVEGVGVLEGQHRRSAGGRRGVRLRPDLRPRGEERTVAELGDDWKCRHSHRARAALSSTRCCRRRCEQPVVGSRAVEAEAALTELAELSSQVLAVALIDQTGNVVAANGDGPLLAGVAAELLTAGAELHGGSPVTRVQVTLGDGGVSVVREGAHTAVATTVAGASQGSTSTTCARSSIGRRGQTMRRLLVLLGLSVPPGR